MIDNCSCCNGCSSMKSSYKSFPKKLLVATSVLVILTMCLTPCEARTVEHKIRHERRHDSLVQPPKEMSRLRLETRVDHKRRTHTKDTPAPIRQKNDRSEKNAQADRFKNAMTKIKKKLKNTRAFFNDERRVLNESKEYRDGMPTWLPTINFVDIHFHNYRNPRRTGASLSERKFIYLMPKLYKSLVEFQDIFKHLAKVEVNFADDPFYMYNKTRQELLEKTLHRLYSTIAEINENMIAVNVTVPHINQNKNINTLDLKVDAPQCLKNDYIAFRAYGNLLNNWYSEFRCPWGKKVIHDNIRCRAYEKKLKEKMQARPYKKNGAS
ncbi:uncharacterized protein LOC115440857 isoform X1 [Manduca sexta]|uniref:uncharacterized protein LOC115440857 isoform X1 n=1 Tax=Manduca sexta TaxID=7130 RepID=UPI00188E91D8|nr:uncharacterized protein LOC115440857 isoform X1 [Manduca sexta]